MTIALSQTQSLKEMLALEEKRAALQGQLDAINQRLSALKDSIVAGGSVAAASSGIAVPAARGRGRPPGSSNQNKVPGQGTYREYIMAALQAAGSVGVRVKDLALAMKTKPVTYWTAQLEASKNLVQQIASTRKWDDNLRRYLGGPGSAPLSRDASVTVNAPGQSGDPRSPHYAALAGTWANQDYVPMLYSRAAVDAAASLVIKLTPG